MSFFDEVETTVANKRLLNANALSDPVVLEFKPFEELSDLDKKTRERLKKNIKPLLRPNTVGFYEFGRFLSEFQEVDANTETNDEGVPKSVRQSELQKLASLFNDISTYTKMTYSNRCSFSSTVLRRLKRLIVPEAVSVSRNPLAHTLDNKNIPGAVNSSKSKHSESHVTSVSANAETQTGAISTIDTPEEPPLRVLKKGSSLRQEKFENVGYEDHLLLDDNDARADQKNNYSQSNYSQSSSKPTVPEEIIADIQECINSESAPVDMFELALYNIGKSLSKHLPNFLESKHYKRYIQAQDYLTKKVSFDDFRVFRMIGRGAFGAVSAVQKLDSMAVFAMKQMNKKKVKSENMERLVVNEKRVLSKMNSPFVLGLNYAFQNEHDLFLVFVMVSGGDLKYHMRFGNVRQSFDEERTKLYAAEVLLGLEHIHSKSIVYRDIKPENILLDNEGHCKISDLGLAIRLRPDKKLRHVAGTGGYWAPEILAKEDTLYVSDIWSWGVLIYEMLSGVRPKCTCKDKHQWCTFGSKRSEEDMAQEDNGVFNNNITYPDTFSDDAKDLLKQIFIREPDQRIGYKGLHQIKEHKYFSSLDWNKVMRREVKPLFVPESHTVNAYSIGEVGEFNVDDYKKIILSEEDLKVYEGFDYVSEYYAEEEIALALYKMDKPRKEVYPQEDDGDCCCSLL